ncbi:hypothetical protein ACLMAL_39260 [Nocardia sp. CWNU-33]|uniref:hypothetical protein n=1 Tax=Nocardia sp. CWNU-33 TaxID=3392117 RepID=UPI00398EBB2B
MSATATTTPETRLVTPTSTAAAKKACGLDDQFRADLDAGIAAGDYRLSVTMFAVLAHKR